MADATQTLILEIKAVDKFAAIDKLLESIKGLDKGVSGTKDKFGQMGKEGGGALDGLAKGFGKAAIAVGVLAVGLKVAVSLMEKLYEGTKLFVGEAIKGQKFRQDTIQTYKALFGSEAEGTKQYDNLFKIASQTPGTVEGLKDATTTFAAAGYTKSQIESQQAAYADIAALFGEEAGKNYASLTSKIKGQGKLTGEALQYESAEKLGTGNIKLNIGKARGFKGSDEEILTKVGKLVSSGDVGVNEANAAIMETLKQKTGQQKLGQFAKDMGTKSISGVLSNIEESFDNIFRQLNPTQMPTLVKFLNGIADALSNPKIKEFFNEALDSLIGGLKDFKPEVFMKAFETGAKWVKIIAEYLGKATAYVVDLINNFNSADFGDFADNILKAIGDGLSVVLEQLAKWTVQLLEYGVMKLLDGSLLQGINDLMEKLVKAIGRGIYAAFEDPINRLIDMLNTALKAVGAKEVGHIGEEGKQDNLKNYKYETDDYALGQLKPGLASAPSAQEGDKPTFNITVSSDVKDPEATGKAMGKAAADAYSSHRTSKQAARQRGLSN